MNALTAALKEELNVEMVPIGPLSVPESVVVSWGIMAFLVIVSILLTRNLKVDHISKRQAALETAVTFLNDFFTGLLGKEGKRYVPYLISVALYIACSNLIGVFGIKPPTKDLNVTAALALMSICLIEYSGIHARGGVGFLKSLAAPTPVMTPMNILEIAIRPDNERSLAVVRKVGARHEGARPGYIYVDGQWRTHETFSLLAEDLAEDMGQGFAARLISRHASGETTRI